MAEKNQPESESSPEKNPKSESGSEAKADGAESSGPSKKLILIVVIAGGVLLGGAGGGLVLGPMLHSARAAKTADPAQEGKGETAEKGKETKGKKEKKHGGKEEKAEGTVFKIDNLIVNPAGTEGSRFLMATVAFELDDPKVEEMLRANDIAIRDQIISVLESQSMEMLTRPGARDSLKSKLAAVVAPFAEGAEMRVYLPQFVIQ